MVELSWPAEKLKGLALALTGVTKRFPGVLALDKASLAVRAGEIHGLVGENGAGKSTIIKILSGVYPRDDGSITIDGEAVADISAAAMHRHGIRVIHQELHLVEHFTVSEAVFLAQERTGAFGLKQGDMRRAAEAFLRDVLACEIDGRTLVRDLGIAERKLVQIAAALIDGEARLVVFDEPTAPLAAAETERVFTAIRRLRERGVSILYVSHYLGEIVGICDRVTVFRNGREVATLGDLGMVPVEEIVALMIGRKLADLYPKVLREPGNSAIEAVGLGDGRRFLDVSFSVREREVFGIAGLVGSGREELMDALYGLHPASHGHVSRKGIPQRLHPSRAVEGGMVLVPRDRRRDGLVLDFDMAANINLASLEQVSTCGFRLERKARARAAGVAERLDIRPRATEIPVRLLSGGNQQKAVLGRWLASGADIFLLDEPTIGVDIGARAEIYRLIAELAGNGAAVIVSSSDAAELVGLCDRIAVMVRGRLAATVSAEGVGVAELLALTTGANVERAAP